jgi:eukaryotic translation initiation factor 2C
MFIGADVTHHTFDATKPSIAAVVGSVDINLTNYCVRLCEQMNKNENKQSVEIILELEDIVFSLLSSFQKKNKGILPKRIVFYRDGIDEGQFKAVRQFEVDAIKKAYKRLNAAGEPALTFVVVQKRNNTRLFPVCQMQNRKGNIVSGTVVDTGITTINDFDFYLCSQDSGQGTAKPTHYWVIHDDNGFTSNDIQNLTYLLCHLYARCTKSVSIPVPVYYAHLAATRGRLHYNYE